MSANKLELKNRLKRGFTLVEVVIAMAVIGVMIALAVAASVIGIRGQTNAQTRMEASSAAGEMYAAFSRTYYEGFYDDSYASFTDDESAAAFLNAYSSDIAAGLNLSENPAETPLSVSSGKLGTEYSQDIDSVTYYTDNGSGTAAEQTCVTRGFTIADDSTAYNFIYTYYVNSLEFDEDDFTYSQSRTYTVTAEVDLSGGYSVKVTAKTGDSSENLFEEEYSFD